MEWRGSEAGISVIDDYGHHPTEIAAVLAAAKTLQRRIVVVFQPHRYSRTKALLQEFGPAFAGADRIILTDIYAASEDPLPGVTVDVLAEVVRGATGVPVQVVPRLEDVAAAVRAIATRGDMVITLGAGSIGSLPEKLVTALERTA